MFEEKRLMFLYCVSPVHMGAGQALGVVDNPIQRERHTGHPVFAGSGIKGALRDEFSAHVENDERTKGQNLTNRIFGPETEAADHAGCVAFTDAQLVLFPVRSLRESFVYATCPTALGRLRRMAELAGEEIGWKIPAAPGDDHCLTVENSGLTVKAKLDGQDVATVILETFQFTVSLDKNGAAEVEKIAKWLKERCLPQEAAYKFFRDKLSKHLVVLSDTRFSHFVENATTVEPHVRISDESGTADDGGLFYTENVPPESLFVSLVMTSQERVTRGASSNHRLTAKDAMGKVTEAIDERTVQLGGDATSGRGLVTVAFASIEKNAKAEKEE
jgi:CRISPR-associated protein Cmr4